MQFWKGQRVVFQGMLGTVQQDQGLDELVRIALDRTETLEYAVNPKKLTLIKSEAEEEIATYFLTRQQLP